MIKHRSALCIPFLITLALLLGSCNLFWPNGKTANQSQLPSSTLQESLNTIATLPSIESPAVTELPQKVLFSDDFSNPLSGWDVRHDADAITDFQNGEFVIYVGKINTTLWSIPNRYMTDVVIDVDIREVAGPDDNLFGVICRYQDANNFYRFVISGKGYAGITKRSQGIVTVLSEPLLSQSPVVNRGYASNHIKAICQGSQLIMYVNDQLVAQAEDSEFSAGDTGLMASSGEFPGVEIHYTNYVITEP